MKMKEVFYVDDLLKSLSTLESAIALVENLIKLCAKGGFNLTKFVSNNRNVWASITLGNLLMNYPSIEQWGYGGT